MPTVETNGVETYYERRGGGPTVVFLHGAGADHRVWAEAAEPLTDAYEVVTLDVRLHGRTGGDPVPAPGFETYVHDLEAVVAALDLGRPALVGLSMGGMIAQAYAARHPHAVAALVTLGAMTPTTQSREEWLIEHLVYPVADRIRAHLGPDYEDRFMRTVMGLRRDDAEQSDMAARDRIETEYDPHYPEQTDAQGDAVREALGDYADLAIDYATLTTPWLYMYGENELSTLEHHADYVADAAPNATVRSVPDASHHAHVDNPAVVLDAIREFLDEHVRPLADAA